MKIKLSLGITLLLIALLIIAISCEVDHGLRPVVYKITGDIVFFKGDPPENTDRVEVFALKEFPPEDPQNFLYLGRSGRLDYSRGDTVSYEVRVSPTEYQLIGVLWKEKGEDWNLTGLMGIYTGETFSILPAEVDVTREVPVVENIDFYANWKVVSKNAALSGRITYEGEWPQDTQILLLAVYRVKPTSEFQLIAFENVDYTQPLFVDESTYRLAVNSGVYNHIVLYWVGKSIKNLTDLVEIGVHGGIDTPAGIDIPDDGELENIDIHVNFNEIDFSSE